MAQYTKRNLAFTVAGVDLTGDGVIAFGAPGQVVADVVGLPGAAGVIVRNRGNGAQQITISVIKKFANDDALESFQAGHFGALTKSGALVVTTGTTAHSTYTASSCCITGVSTAEPEALMLIVTYSIVSSPLL